MGDTGRLAPPAYEHTDEDDDNSDVSKSLWKKHSSSITNMHGACMDKQLSMDRKDEERSHTPSALPPDTVHLMRLNKQKMTTQDSDSVTEHLEETLLSTQFVDLLNSARTQSAASSKPGHRHSNLLSTTPTPRKTYDYKDTIILELCSPVDQILGWSSCFAPTKGARKRVQALLAVFFFFVSGYGTVRCTECIYNGFPMLTHYHCAIGSQYVMDGKLAFNAANTARLALLSHFVMALLATYFISRISTYVPLLVDHFPVLLQQWLRVYDHVTNEHVPVHRMINLNYRLFTYTFVGAVTYTTTFALSCADVSPIVFPGNCTSLICSYFDQGEGNCVGNSILVSLCTVPILYMQILYCLLCMIVYYEFDHFEHRFLHPNTRSTQPADQVLQEYRQQHFELVQLCDRVDSVVQYYTWWVFCVDITILCALIYVQMLESLSNAEQLSLTVWDVQKICSVLFVALPASFVAEKAYQPLILIEEFSNRKPTEAERMSYLDSVLRTLPKGDDADRASSSTDQPIASSGQQGTQQRLLDVVHDARRLSAQVASKPQVAQCFWLTPELYHQITLFNQQLTNRAVGISCAGFFFLTKSIMLTLISILITYFALILQMDMAASSVCTCDCANSTLHQGLFRGFMTTNF